MDQLKGSTALVGAIAAVALIVSGFVAVSGGKTGPMGPMGPQGPQGVPGVPGSDGKDLEKFGAVPTLEDVSGSRISLNSVKEEWVTRPVGATSTSLCILKNPLNATSSIEGFSIAITSNGLGTQNFDFSTTSSTVAGHGSSTPVLGRDTLSGTDDHYIWAPRATTSVNDVVGGNPILTQRGNLQTGTSVYELGPNEYLSVRVSTSSAGGGTFSSYMTGQCKFKLRSVI